MISQLTVFLPAKSLKFFLDVYVNALIVLSLHSLTNPTFSAPRSSLILDAPTKYMFLLPSISFPSSTNGLTKSWAPSKKENKLSKLLCTVCIMFTGYAKS